MQQLNEQYCNNCGKRGHLYHQCKLPITSIGIIAFRINNNELQYLMIRRKDTLGYIDFMRGKYSIFNKDYIMNMLKQMTLDEKRNLHTLNFDALWKGIWGNESLSNQYKMEESISREKFNALKNGIVLKNTSYNLDDLLIESKQFNEWNEAEWGFPKGRRNYQENDFDCALREFAEETGYNVDHLHNIQNILPFEEIFTGSNYKSYKHKYYLTFIKMEDTMQMSNYERTEVSKMEWKSYDECMNIVRPYNLEKKRLITNVHQTIKTFRLFSL
jgi:ADP-ribose pyrophosphatase YjhB (NUDIX family)